jgi:hypothetical protein
MRQVDQNKLDSLLGRMVGDLGAVATARWWCWGIVSVFSKRCKTAKA